jgi:hypothetical protein
VRIRLGRDIALLAATGLALGCGSGGATGGSAREQTPAPAVVDNFVYGPFATSYRLVSRNHTEQEFGGQVTAIDFDTELFLSAEAVPADDGNALSLTIDSIVPGSTLPPGVTQADFEGATGATFRGTLHPTGEITDFQTAEGSGSLLTQMNRSMRNFLPAVPEGGVHPGETWTDSTTIMAPSGGMDIEVSTVTTYESGDWTDESGLRVLPVSARSDFTVAGGGNQGGTEITIDGTGVSWSQLQLSADGRLVSRIAADTANMTATVIAMGTIIPITQIRFDTLSVVR